MTINVDTDAKTFDVILNGNKLNDIRGIEIYKSCCSEEEDEYYVHLRTAKEVDGVMVTTMYSLECEKESASADLKAPKIDGFVAQKVVNPLHKQIQDWLKK